MWRTNSYQTKKVHILVENLYILVNIFYNSADLLHFSGNLVSFGENLCFMCQNLHIFCVKKKSAKYLACGYKMTNRRYGHSQSQSQCLKTTLSPKIGNYRGKILFFLWVDSMAIG